MTDAIGRVYLDGKPVLVIGEVMQQLELTEGQAITNEQFQQILRANLAVTERAAKS